MTKRDTYKGPALFSYGFRPFFLSACLFALVVIPVWWLIWRGEVTLAGPLSPVDWHIHEMVFGYGAAVVAGFLFTAVPNWTGRLPTRGRPLALLLALWVAGRVAVGGLTGLGPVAVALIRGFARASSGTRRRRNIDSGMTTATVITASARYTARQPCSASTPARITGQIAPDR